MDFQLDAVALGMIAMIVPLAVNRLKQWNRVPKWVLPWACVVLGALGEAAYSAALTTDGITLSGLITGVLAGTAGLWGREARDQWVKARRNAAMDKVRPRAARLRPTLRRDGE
jgi:hypothetical protein